jgi:two-component system, NarL family, nitrate/nitrite response regulator NarL
MTVDRKLPIRVVVVDDHTLFRRGLVSLLAADGRFEVVAEAGDAGQAQVVVERERPDVLLLDNHLPGVSGVDALPALLHGVPGMRVLMLTMSEDHADIVAALSRGAAGYLLKTAEIDELGDAIVSALSGNASLSAAVALKLAVGASGDLTPRPQTTTSPAPQPSRERPVSALARLTELSVRERETLELVAEGCSNKVVARRLGIAEATVKIHVQNLLRKLGLESRVHAAAWYARAGAPGGRPEDAGCASTSTGARNSPSAWA